jgi:hypothetical protein
MSSALACVAALVHSLIGELKVYRPLFAATEFSGAMQSQTWRRVTRAVWHLPSVCWLLMASMVLLLARDSAYDPIPFYFASAVYATSALGNFVATRGRHIGWVVLTAAAALLLIRT